MTLAGYPGLLAGFGPPFLNVSPLVTTGKMFFVSSVTGLANNVGDDSLRPLATISQALAKCRANKGDHIMLLPSHAETITTAGGVTVSTAGVTVIGMGFGAQRPTFTFSTAAGASFLVSAADFKMYNVVGVSGVDALTNPFSVQASGCSLDMEWQDPSSSLQAVRVVLAGSTAIINNLFIKLRVLGVITGGTSPVNAIRLGGTATNVVTGVIQADFYGRASTSFVEFVTLASVDIQVTGTMYNSGTTNGSKNVVDTITGTTWMVSIFDAAAGLPYSGGSGAAAALGATGSPVVPTADSTANVLSRDVVGNKTDTLIDVVGTDKSLTAYAKGILANLSGAAGIATYPAGAAYANAVSMAEVLAYIQDGVRRTTGTTLPAATSLWDVLGTATGSFTFPTAAIPANNVSIGAVLSENYNLMERGIATGAATVQVATVTIFTITGGAIEVVELFAEFQAQAQASATTLQFNCTPTLGSAAVLSLASASLSGTAAGSIVLCTGTFGGAPTVATVNAIAAGTTKFIVGAGTLSYIGGTATNSTTVKYYLRFKPLSRGVSVTAAF